MRHPRPADLPLTIDRSAPRSLVVQIADGLREVVRAGVLQAGDPLPSTRALATRLGVARGTVVAAYDQLHGEGWLVADEGATRVDPGVHLDHPGRAPAPSRSVAAQTDPPSGADVIDLRPGQPDVSDVVDGAWRAAWRSAVGQAGARHDPSGSLALRSALAEHVRIARGVVVGEGEILVTAGVREGLQLVLTALVLGQDARDRQLRVAVEDPGYPALRRVIAALGHEVVPVPVDEAGLRVDHLDSDLDAVLVTPGHQYPLGGAMPVGRRLELIAWARDHGAIVLEDDYDGELRFTGEPVPALAALDRGDEGVVVTLGSFAKVLAPGIGLGHVIVPMPLRQRVMTLRNDVGCPVPATVQDALEHYLDAGALRRHTARMRRRYRDRRDVALRLLSGLEGVRVRPMDGGLHAVVELEGVDAAAERAVVAEARACGVLVAGMADYWSDLRPRHPVGGLPRHGLVVGLGPPSLEEGLTRLREVIAPA